MRMRVVVMKFGGSEGVWVDKYVSWGRPKSKIADK